MKRLRTISAAVVSVVVFAWSIHAQERPGDESPVIWIGLQNGSEREARMAADLRAVFRKYDLAPWVLTQNILIDESQIPHSHPILTIHTRYIDDELRLLSTLVHEQLHWLEEPPWLGRFRAAMQDYEGLFPVVPDSDEGGARDAESTYRHLLVCDLEFQAMSALVGESTARETLASFSHYSWIYDRVLTDSRVREVALRHGFNVSDGAPERT